ncbi:MAG: hypothetical protein AAFP90_23770, partial [Planctomycetota bacterium]
TPTPTVDLNALRAWLRLSDPGIDETLRMLHDAAAELIESETRLAIAPRVIELQLTRDQIGHAHRLPRGPFLDVVEIAATRDGQETSVDATAIVTHDGRLPGCITIDDPGVPFDALVVRFRLGHAELPPRIRLVIFQLVAHWETHREAATGDAPPRELPLAYRHIVATLNTHQDAIT